MEFDMSSQIFAELSKYIIIVCRRKSLRAALVGHKDEDSDRCGSRSCFPASVGEASHISGLQGLQHPS